jgi:hypothetical protein
MGFRFIRSAQGPNEVFTYCGSSLRVIGVEEYDSAVAVTWIINPEPNLSDAFPEESAAFEQDVRDLGAEAADILRKTAERLLRERRLYKFELADDLGTSYTSMEKHYGAAFVSNGGTRESIGIKGQVMFHPPPSSRAHVLTFRWFDVSIEIPLTWSTDRTLPFP